MRKERIKNLLLEMGFSTKKVTSELVKLTTIPPLWIGQSMAIYLATLRQNEKDDLIRQLESMRK